MSLLGAASVAAAAAAAASSFAYADHADPSWSHEDICIPCLRSRAHTGPLPPAAAPAAAGGDSGLATGSQLEQNIAQVKASLLQDVLYQPCRDVGDSSEQGYAMVWLGVVGWLYNMSAEV